MFEEVPLAIDVRPDRHRVIVTPFGALDHFTAPKLRTAIDELIATGWREIVLDLSKLEFMDSGGVHLLEACRDVLGDAASFSMVDGTAPVSLALTLMPEPVLPRADVAH